MGLNVLSVSLRVDYEEAEKRTGLLTNNELFTTRMLGIIGRSKVPIIC